MEISRACRSCRERTLESDYVTGNTVCSSCGVVQDYDNFQADFGGFNGPAGTFVRVGTAGTGSVCNYKEKKVYEAKRLIDELMSELGVSASDEVRKMVETITEGEYGEGHWFPIFVGACAYVVMRRDNKSLPIVEVAAVIRCDVHELGRMVARVVSNLGMKLPEFDIVIAFKRAILNSHRFNVLSEDKVERVLKQGIFLLQCSVKWFLTTGRRPLPMVAAVVVFVAKLNQVDARIEDVAKELHVALATTRLRYKELLESLVKVAQALPWGKDITVKNIVKNAPHVIQYMELKSMGKRDKTNKSLEHVGFDLDDMVSDITSKEIEYGTDDYCIQSDCQYFEAGRSSSWNIDELDKFKISPECLSMIYSKFLDEVPHVNSVGESGEENIRKGGRKYVHACTEWWKGQSELSKKLFLKQILGKDVGLNAMPPSYVTGCLAYQRRSEKIKAAKLRIDKVMRPAGPDSGDRDDSFLTKCVKTGKKRRKMQVDIDWEDFVIETLLLHQVEEGEIEKGHYNTLLDLHVFNSGIL
ncbi:plant-specific TFIIB-related protein PTF2 [Cornus florida]|uniref:plant-specific TFIIB-related protein PTF2 n=1 Tax=Cornus florida TaxID=4283 RepID=UPI002896B0EA|nr:plant-specific TFIIB-related protein PTF2 [Cornus florida]